MKKRKDDASQNLPDTFEDDVYEALRHKGLLMPMTPQDVRLAEEALHKGDIQLPSELRDPVAVFQRGLRPLRIARPSQSPNKPVPQDVQENLARAAREGGKLSPEVELRMKQDRERAEKVRQKHAKSS